MGKRKSVFITGAANGIGRACAEHFVSRGWLVGACDISQDGIASLVAELGEDACWGGQLDVTDYEAWERELAAFAEVAGGIDVLLNNAGILTSGSFQSIPPTAHHAVMNVNVNGVMNGCHAAFPYLQRSKGCTINMASASAIYGQPDIASYSSSKFAVRGLTEGLNLEWEPYGIRVVDIWPLFVQTNMVSGMKSRAIKKMGVKLVPEDVAKVVFEAANGSGMSKVHWLVGAVTRLYAPLVGVVPTWATRQINKKLTGMNEEPVSD